ncbi:hypothetical protein FYZ48_28660 [Gimesia chilikensis]|uniref:hypothetical protein n=1 Tax=Gimesia chilikensis TaxID=2605989 RepID=UPI0011EC8779|nr:hypothetical protein [Gimesia chilikensis]KAA0132089.1 hypothetical protein FYZ48_28660 [Gimesia chilikensis]
MNHSLKISPPTERDWYSDDTKKALRPLQKKIAEHNSNVVAHEQLRSKAESEDIESLTSKDLFTGQVSTAYRFDLYKEAISLCDKVAEFSKLHNADRRLRYEDIVQQLETRKAKIREELTTLGYEKDALHQSHVHAVENFYRMHPEVQKLLHSVDAFKYPHDISGGDRAALVAGMTNLRNRCLAT